MYLYHQASDGHSISIKFGHAPANRIPVGLCLWYWEGVAHGTRARKRRLYIPAQTRRTIRHWGKLLRALYADDTEALKVIETVSQEAFDLSDHRTALVHYFWPWRNDDPERICLQSISGVKGDPDKLVILKYEASVDDLDDLNNRLYDLYNRVLKISMAAGDRHRDQSKGDRGGE